MKDNFDLYSWNKNRYLNKENTPQKPSTKEFDLYEWNKKRYLGELNIDRGGDDAKMGAELESDSNVVGEAEEKEYEVEYWILTRDGYDNEYIKVKAGSEEEALKKAEEETRRGKNFKIYKR